MRGTQHTVLPPGNVAERVERSLLIFLFLSVRPQLPAQVLHLQQVQFCHQTLADRLTHLGITGSQRRASARPADQFAKFGIVATCDYVGPCVRTTPFGQVH